MIETIQALARGSGFETAAQGRWRTASGLVPVLVLLLVMVVLRCWVACQTDFETDETYYWLWSRHLASSYFDHPPMVAYLIRPGTMLFGDTILGVRSMAILAMAVASALLYALALILFNDRRIGLLALLWFSLMPHTAFFSIVMFPDTPAILFWVLSCVGLAMVWRSGRGEWWYLVGVATGLVLLSKYTGFFLAAGIIAWLLVSAEMRRWLKRYEPYVAGVIALALYSPVILWNAQHGWASFSKQFGRALENSSDGGLYNLATFVGIQAAFVSPLIFVFIIAGLAVATWRGLRRQEANWLLLALTSAPLLIYFSVHALSAEVLPQWPSAAYPAGVVAAVAAFAAPAHGFGRRALSRYAFAAAPWVGLIFTLTLFAQMTIRPVRIVAAHDPLSRFSGWAELSSDVRALARAQHADYIATNEYGNNAVLAFYLRNMTVFQTSESIRYVFQPPVDQALLGRATGLYVAVAPDDLARLQEHFDSVEFISTISRTRNGDPVESFRIYRLKNYRGGLPF